MSSNIFLIIAVVTTGIFVIQFILSIFFGDIDADVDVDADISSMVSFKGLTHFGEVSCGVQNKKLKSLLESASIQPPVAVEMRDGTASITLHLMMKFGARI